VGLGRLSGRAENLVGSILRRFACVKIWPFYFVFSLSFDGFWKLRQHVQPCAQPKNTKEKND
jgi:hypothetical protein